MNRLSAREHTRSAVQAERPERLHGKLPDILWTAGMLCGLAAPTVAVVGTRAPSSAGERVAFEIARALGEAGICIISGLARGVDAAAHRGALDAGAPTIGVLAGGHDNFYPRDNAALAERMIAGGGAVVSAYEPAAIPFPARFLERNGIITALADAVVIVEAPMRSGALNTASWAADAGIPVLAVPGDVDRPKVAGCLALIRDGAILARGADDVLEALGLPARIKKRRSRHDRKAAPGFAQLFSPVGASAVESAVLAAFRDLPDASLEELARATDANVPELLRTLQQLILKGAVQEGADGRFGRSHARVPEPAT